jgi:hypothetical protein
MSNYLEKLHKNQIHFPEAHANLLRNLFYMVASLKDEEEIRMNMYGGFEKYRDCVKDEGLKGVTFTIRWERDVQGYKKVAYRAVIKPKVVLAQLEKYCAA